MIEVADVFRRFAAEYLDAHGATMPPSHQRAIADILDCRTATLGGQVWHCEDCGAAVDSLIEARDRPTVSKVRLVGLAQHRHPQQYGAALRAPMATHPIQLLPSCTRHLRCR